MKLSPNPKLSNPPMAAKTLKNIIQLISRYVTLICVGKHTNKIFDSESNVGPVTYAHPILVVNIQHGNVRSFSNKYNFFKIIKNVSFDISKGYSLEKGILMNIFTTNV